MLLAVSHESNQNDCGQIQYKMKKIFYFLLGNLIPQLILASLFLWLAAIIEKEEFANLALLDSIYQGLLIILLFGMDKAIERFSFTERAQQYTEKLLVTTSLVCLGIGVAVTAIYSFLDYFFPIKPLAGIHPNWMYALFASTTLAAIFQLFVSYRYVQSDATSFAILRAVRALIFSLVLLVVIYFDFSVIFGKIVGDFLACSIPLIILIFMARRTFKTYQFQSKIVKEILPYSAPFVIALIASFSLNHIDRFFIASYIDLESLANYSLSQRVVGLVALVTGSVALIVPPFFYRNIRTDPEKVYLIITEMMTLCFWLCIGAACALPVAISLFYGEKYSAALSYIPLLLVGVYLSVAVSFSTALCLLVDKRSVLNMTTGILAAITSVGLNLILLPLIGVYGSIMAYVVSMSGLYALQYFIVRKRFRNLPKFPRQTIVLLISSTALSYLIRIENNITLPMSVLLIAMAVCSVILMLFGLKNASITHA